MYALVFCIEGGGTVPFKCSTMEVVMGHVKNYIEALEKASKEQKECCVFAEDDKGNKVGMVRVSKVFGYFIHVEKPDPAKEALKKMADAVERESNRGDEWKG